MKHNTVTNHHPVFEGETSVLGKQWLMRNCDERQALMMSQRHDLPPLLGRILAIRGVADDQIAAFLDPKIRHWMPDPFTLCRMDKAVDAILPLIAKQGVVGILGDYDVDGATATALLATFLRRLGVTVHTHIPHRHTEGYGPNIQALRKLKEQGAELVMTLDCGVTAFDVLEQAHRENIAVVVIDHHQAEPHLPPAVAVVNPNCLDDTSGLGYLAAVGVTFMYVVAVNSRLRTLHPDKTLTGEQLLSYLDWVALGTVCDLVPLVALNRAMVKQGLRVMQSRQNIGLTALSDQVKIDKVPNAYHLGFLLGPRINAGGRLGCSDLGLALLCAPHLTTATQIAQQLNDLNTERQDIEKKCLEQAQNQIEMAIEREEDSPVISPYLTSVYSPDWNSGVVGIVAGRLKDTYNRPACVIAVQQDEQGHLIGKGSGRSVRGVDLGTAVISARQQGLLLAGGGHATACGFSVAMENYDAFVKYLNDHIARQLQGGDIVPTLPLDGTLSVSGATPDLVHILNRLEPFGMGNSEPRFMVRDVQVAYVKIVKDVHIHFTIKDYTGAKLKGAAFNCVNNAMGQALLQARDKHSWIHMTGKIRLNSWQGRDSIQFLPDDIFLL